MINANELRIGNWVIFSEDRTKFIIEEISKTGLVVQNDQETAWIEIEEFEPIPLTEEILLKCGFEKEPMAYSKSIDHFGGGKKLTFSGDYVYIVDSEKQNTIPTDIITLWNKDICKEFYLHQLQNLYFALTGQELEINL